jgi:hypothetical protein
MWSRGAAQKKEPKKRDCSPFVLLSLIEKVLSAILPSEWSAQGTRIFPEMFGIADFKTRTSYTHEVKADNSVGKKKKS